MGDAPRALPAAVPLIATPVLGMLGALGMPPLGLAWVTVVAVAGLLMLLPRARSSGQSALWAWLFATAYFAVSLRWIMEPFQVEADIFGWMAPFALALMASGLALFWAVAGWVAVRFWVQPVPRILGFVVAVSLAEVARAYVFTGFPWAALAQVWVDTPFIQTLGFVGPHGLALLTMLLAAGLALGVYARKVACVVGVSAVAAFFVLPWSVAPLPSYDPETRPVVRIVQPNAPQHEKWDPDKWHIFFWRQVEATRAPGPRPDLVVWPETAIPQLLSHADEALAIITEAAQGVPVALGLQQADARHYYNAMIVLDADGAVGPIYQKHHLVPFGEYMPFPELFKNLGIRALAQRAEGGYAAGPGPRVLDLGDIGRALALICYEAVFPQHASARGERPDFLMQVTNDAWFGTYAGPQQHLAQARMRAIEQGLPLVRAANTGISAMIDPRGKLLDSLPLGTHGHIDVPLPPPGSRPFYALTGDWFALGLLFLAAAGLWRVRTEGTKTH